jgi:(1->4)-alpha-D-glucan 1-alpha-D-glucosylmutase
VTHPTSTYRLQIRPEFDLFAAARLVPYLADLGVGTVYLSPLLAATPGSDHGYDIVDHSRIDPARGGAEGLAALSAAARDHGLGVLADIVPNHMGVGIPHLNPWWWDLLRHGPDSRYAEAFDVDWHFGGGRVRLPVLDDDAPALERDGDELRLGELRLPIAPDSDGDPDRQHWELIHWRRADDELNYRRFFAVSSLAGIRVEVPWVFEQSHAEIARWVREGLVDGLRVDHPDGLADPGGYLERLVAETGCRYVLVEKILERGERLPPHWAVAGTTGYETLAEIDRVLVDPNGRAALDALDARLREPGGPVDWADLIHDTKRGIADGILHSEMRRLAREAGADGDRSSPIVDAFAELCATFPVYRSYLPFGVEHLDHALADARRRRPDLADALGALEPLVRDPGHPAGRRLQQTTGMVMAKGVEDTAFYRYTRLTSLTEVGGDPAEFALDPAAFHDRQAERLAAYPATMTTLTTHDTKRGEDVRARIDVFAEVPDEWAALLDELRAAAPLGDGPLEHLLWGAAVGAWPISRERLHEYATKAAREAGDSTSWNDPDQGFETRMHATLDAAYDDPTVTGALEGFVRSIERFGWSNSLSAKLIQLTAPGVPDVYQGSELSEQSLVDPANRREVDFGLRELLLGAIRGGAHPPDDDGGAAKLMVVHRALVLRRDRPELFTRYLPLAAVGERAEHVVAFDRGGAITVATRLPVGLARAGGWGETHLLLPDVPVIDVLTGARIEGGEVPLESLLGRYPVALLAVVQ